MNFRLSWKYTLVSVLIILLLVAITFGLINKNKSAAVSPLVNAATPSSQTINPSKNEESLPTSYPTSSTAKPALENVYRFEIAYNDPNPVTRSGQLQPFVTSQYLKSEMTSGVDKSDGLVINVNKTKSKISFVVSKDKLSCTVTSVIWLTTSRAGKRVTSFPAPTHVTLWVNTTSGWRVAEDKEVG